MNKVKGMPKSVEKAIKEVLVAREEWDRINKIDLETKQEVLNAGEYFEEDTLEAITDPSSDFLMSDVDFKKYCEDVYELNKSKGIDSGGCGTTLWAVRERVLKSENSLIDAVANDVPTMTQKVIETIKTSPSKRAEFLKILSL